MVDATQLKYRYSDVFGEEPNLLVRSPGRINIIGEHTDYNEGFVLPTAINKAVYVAVGNREDKEIHLYAESFEEHIVAHADMVEVADTGWANYMLGVVSQLQGRGLNVRGFNLYLDSDLPLGAGLSSSAAVACGVGFALNELFTFGIPRQDIAKIAQLAEHAFAGVKCGIMDQFASVLSKEGHVLKLDCRSLEYEYVPLELHDYEIILLNTNVKHSLASSAYNDRRASCEQGVAWIQASHPEVQSLRDVTTTMLEDLVKPKDKEVYTKCAYVVQENDRLHKACDALKNGDIHELGRQLFSTHEALRSAYDVSCPELDFLVNYVKALPAVVGARMMGGGFGGCTINIVKKGHSQRLVDEVAPLYAQRFGLELEGILVEAKGGTDLLTC